MRHSLSDAIETIIERAAMALLGVKRLVFGVDDVETSVRFFADFGLDLAERRDGGARFALPEGSSVEVRPIQDASLPAPFLEGNGPREVIWGVDTQENLDAVNAELAHDRTVTVDPAGTLHTRDDIGMAIGFELFARKAPEVVTPPENTTSRVARWNQHRQWYDVARPKVIFHVVFGTPEIDKAVAFYLQRLNFRLTDINRGVGMFMRCDGRHEHHNLFFLKTPKPIFSHVSFGVDNVDELMAGANQMQRKKWAEGMGLGRHRVSSLVFYYLKAPVGGQVEYSADCDYLTDEWKPRLWDPHFGHIHWMGQAGETAGAPHGEFEILTGPVPKLADTVRAS
jgi:catechol 2,3-dioxygenase-like lactoylglutathione lyase family enzyme